AAFQRRGPAASAVTIPSHAVHILCTLRLAVESETLPDGERGLKLRAADAVDRSRCTYERSGQPGGRLRHPGPAGLVREGSGGEGRLAEDPPPCDHGADRPIRLWQVDGASLPEPDERPRLERPRRRPDPLSGSR